MSPTKLNKRSMMLCLLSILFVPLLSGCATTMLSESIIDDASPVRELDHNSKIAYGYIAMPKMTSDSNPTMIYVPNSRAGCKITNALIIQLPKKEFNTTSASILSEYVGSEISIDSGKKVSIFVDTADYNAQELAERLDPWVGYPDKIFIKNDLNVIIWRDKNTFSGLRESRFKSNAEWGCRSRAKVLAKDAAFIPAIAFDAIAFPINWAFSTITSMGVALWISIRPTDP